jgi:hypothetical protein
MSESKATPFAAFCRRQPSYGPTGVPPIMRSTLAAPNDGSTSTPAIPERANTGRSPTARRGQIDTLLPFPRLYQFRQ